MASELGISELQKGRAPEITAKSKGIHDPCKMTIRPSPPSQPLIRRITHAKQINFNATPTSGQTTSVHLL